MILNQNPITIQPKKKTHIEYANNMTFGLYIHELTKGSKLTIKYTKKDEICMLIEYPTGKEFSVEYQDYESKAIDVTTITGRASDEILMMYSKRKN